MGTVELNYFDGNEQKELISIFGNQIKDCFAVQIRKEIKQSFDKYLFKSVWDEKTNLDLDVLRNFRTEMLMRVDFAKGEVSKEHKLIEIGGE